MSFPPDKLQVISPSLGTSIIGIWTGQPHYDNQTGRLNFQGGVPSPGINTSRGLIATVTFRVRTVGQAVIRFLDSSKVLLNDGLATNILTSTGNGIYEMTLPPPAGPIVVSETHRDQASWYKATTVALQWANQNPVTGYSYVLNQEPIDIPDDISEGAKDNTVYKALPDGVYFFHVKALRSGVWGATSHFAVKVDSTQPADFPIEISPSARTSSRHPAIYFATTDAASGIDHFEIKIVQLDRTTDPQVFQEPRQSFFLEAESPYTPELNLGRYDVIVRAYDYAGNFREVTQRLSITTSFLIIFGFSFLPRWLSILVWILLLGALSWFAYWVWQWHRKVHLEHLIGALKDPEIARQLEQLKEKQSEYMNHIPIIVLAFTTAMALFGFADVGLAQTVVTAPPIVTTIAKNITNEEIFYVGGKAVVPDTEVIVYIQAIHDGETFSQTVIADNKGDWFYSYPKFLSAGRYLVWTQSKIGPQLSAPSAQFDVSVAQTALQFGASRISSETLYFVLMFVFFWILIFLIGFTIYHGYHGRRKNKSLMKEIFEAEEAIKRGFLVLHRDLQAELGTLSKIKARGELSAEDLEKEKRLVKDLDWVGKFIEKEVKDIERLTR